MLQAWSKESNHTYIATPAQSWIDDYFDWTKTCCIYNASTINYDGFCPTDVDTSNQGSTSR